MVKKETAGLVKKRIGIITLHRWYNYGSMLQAYASNYLLNGLGYDCEQIDFVAPRQDNNRAYRLWQPLPEYAGLQERYAEELLRRKENFAEFTNLSRINKNHYTSDAEIGANPPEFDIYITGGDQLWNVNFRIASAAYFLAFTDSTEKYAFSVSIGRCKEDKLEGYKQYIAQYKKIFVREQAGADLLARMLGDDRNISTMIDPTLILDAEEWLKVASERSFYDGDYIGCYATLDDDLDVMMPVLWELHRRLGLKVVMWGMTLPREEDWVVNIVDAGPKEWLRLVKNAKLLVTNSFHGTAFASNFGVPFITYADQLENPRKEGILKQLNHSHRLVHSVDDLDRALAGGMDFAYIKKILAANRERAIADIKECLGDQYVSV